MKQTTISILSGILLIATSAIAVATEQADKSPPQLAFPTAEGYGRFATGGRGGDVYHVTNLNDTGKGSLRDAIESWNGPRTIVFDISGTIRITKRLEVKNIHGLTIAGQTAPGEGITIRDEKFGIRDSSNIVIRYMRFRLGSESGTETDTLGVDQAENVIFDHVTATWGVDGTMDTSHIKNFTLQWSMFGEALNNSNHHKGNHAMLMSFRKTDGNVSIHHNLLFSSRNRHPTLGGGKPKDCNTRAIFDFRNNIVYNQKESTNLAHGIFNLINNYYRPGESTDLKLLPLWPKAEAHDITRGYFSGNFFEGHPERTQHNYTAMRWGPRSENYFGNVTLKKFKMAQEPVAAADRPLTQSAEKAYELVLNFSGASKVRDSADLRVIRGVRNRTHKLIDTEKQVGGWPALKSQKAPLDKDQDGMHDRWEKERKLDPTNPHDRNGYDLDPNYTNLEVYINGLVSKE
ncbi:MAG: pectate lyase [Planctomycetaceae bacterium]|nr:pectate lyase [Planctomycetaceae bacterium]